MGKTFTNFLDLSQSWLAKSPEKVAQKALHKIAVSVRKSIREMHGSTTLKANSALTIAMKGRNSPLRDTGSLANAVSFIATSKAAVIFSKNPKLQRIHEFGAKWKMSDKQRRFLMAMLSEKNMGAKLGRPRTTHKGWIIIPPRPIWRFALDRNKDNIKKILREELQALTN